MTDTDAPRNVDEAVRTMLLAYERLDAMWRRDFGLDADEKLVLLFMVEQSAATVPALTEYTQLDRRTIDAIVDRLERDQFVRAQRDPAGGDPLLTLTKRGLSARLKFDAAYQGVADLGRDIGDRGIGCFAQRATGLLTRLASEYEEPTS